jgi:hypothetical protein
MADQRDTPPPKSLSLSFLFPWRCRGALRGERCQSCNCLVSQSFDRSQWRLLVCGESTPLRSSVLSGRPVHPRACPIDLTRPSFPICWLVSVAFACLVFTPNITAVLTTMQCHQKEDSTHQRGGLTTKRMPPGWISPIAVKMLEPFEMELSELHLFVLLVDTSSSLCANLHLQRSSNPPSAFLTVFNCACFSANASHSAVQRRQTSTKPSPVTNQSPQGKKWKLPTVSAFRGRQKNKNNNNNNYTQSPPLVQSQAACLSCSMWKCSSHRLTGISRAAFIRASEITDDMLDEELSTAPHYKV